MSTFAKSWDSRAVQDVCIFCSKDVLECELAGNWRRDGKVRTVHAGCRPLCSRRGPEKVQVRGSFIFHPELKDGDIIERQSPCWDLFSDDEPVCAYHRWLETAKPGDSWL